MPQTEVVFFKETGGAVPVLVWMDGLVPKAQDKLLARVELLGEKGHELRRPHSDILRDGIHELRTRLEKVQFRILYFFHGQRAVLAHGLTKTDVVPDSDIDLTIERKGAFEGNPEGHTYRET